MNELTVRPCREEDFDAIFGLLGQLWSDMQLDRDAMRNTYAQILDCGSQKFIVGLSGGRVVAFCSLTIRNSLWAAGSLGHLDELIVDGDLRGRGIGRAMLDAATAIARENGCRRVELDTAFHRKEAHAFYEREGFENRGYIFSKIL